MSSLFHLPQILVTLRRCYTLIVKLTSGWCNCWWHIKVKTIPSNRMLSNRHLLGTAKVTWADVVLWRRKESGGTEQTVFVAVMVRAKPIRQLPKPCNRDYKAERVVKFDKYTSLAKKCHLAVYVLAYVQINRSCLIPLQNSGYWTITTCKTFTQKRIADEIWRHNGCCLPIPIGSGRLVIFLNIINIQQKMHTRLDDRDRIVHMASTMQPRMFSLLSGLRTIDIELILCLLYICTHVYFRYLINILLTFYFAYRFA